jgi:hypothetical protein
LSPKEYGTRLKNDRARLSEIGTEGVELGVEASLELSYRSLAEGPAQALRHMSVFPSAFDAEAEAVVCQGSQNRYLGELERRSLVQFEAKSWRYRLHDLVRVFASGKGSVEERAEAEERHAVHYERVFLKARDLYDQGGEGVFRGLDLYDQEWLNIRAGLLWLGSELDEDERTLALGKSYAEHAASLAIVRFGGASPHSG